MLNGPDLQQAETNLTFFKYIHFNLLRSSRNCALQVVLLNIVLQLIALKGPKLKAD